MPALLENVLLPPSPVNPGSSKTPTKAYMKIALRVLLGTLLGILAWVIAFVVTAVLIMLPTWSTSMKAHHPDMIVITSKILVIIPCVVSLGAAFRKIFPSHRTLCAAVAMGLALIAESAAIRFPPGSWWLVVLPFLFGPAAVAYLLDLFRSNSRSTGS